MQYHCQHIIHVLLIGLMLVSMSRAENGIDSVAVLKRKLVLVTNDTSKVDILDHIAMLLKKAGDTEALTYANDALRLAKRVGYRKGYALAAYRVGSIYLESGEFKQALYYLLTSMRIAKEMKDWDRYTRAVNSVGIVHASLNDLDKGYRYFKHALIMNRSFNIDNELLASNLNNIGLVLLKKKNVTQAVSYFTQALKMTRSVHGVSGESMSLCNLAEAYRLKKNFVKALAYSDRNIQLATQSGHVLGLLLSYATKGQIFTEMKKYPEARSYFLKALDLAQRRKLRSYEADVVLELSKLHEQIGESIIALEYYKKYSALNDSLFNERNIKQIHFMQVMHESGKKDEQIRSLNKDKEISVAKAEKEHLFTDFIIIISLLIIVIGVIIGRNLVLKQSVKNKRLNEEKGLVEMEKRAIERDNAQLSHENILAKYEVLKSKINPHFLFNSLSTLSSIIPKGSKQAETFIENFSDFYRKIIETTEVELLSLKEELKIVETYLYLQQMEFSPNLIVKLRIEESSGNLLIPPFAVQMVVENAIKHNEISNEKPLTISIITQDDNLVISNTIQRKSKKYVSTGTGERNIKERYKHFSIRTPDFRDTGVRYIVTLPLLRKEQHSVLSYNAN